MDALTTVEKLMTAFEDDTGLSGDENPPRRYLWTDAFAVCNFLALFERTNDKNWLASGLKLVDQVHFTLGRHRDDDPRRGWISGLSEAEGKKHPTRGGLRIGKKLNERRPAEQYDPDLEWNRDGQYYHYLTKWMHALNRVSRVTGDPRGHVWAVDLAKAAHAGFVHAAPAGPKKMYWKMSVDLSYPLVPAMGQHDPLDGLIVYSLLRAASAKWPEAPARNLDAEISEIAGVCQGISWNTSDPLGVGGLLCDALFVAQLIADDGPAEIAELLPVLLETALAGLDACAKSPNFKFPADCRLAFRELGMTIGLHAAERLASLAENRPDAFSGLEASLNRFRQYFGWTDILESFWLAPENREVHSWTDHPDINRAMLATSLLPDGYLGVSGR